VKVLLATDSFPPRCGGSGWSTFELARGLGAIGHEVLVVQPKPGEAPGPRTREYEGIRAIETGFPAPRVPYVRNYFKNERLYPALADVLSGLIAGEGIDIVHGQHVLTALPSIDAARRRGVPAVCTVRDYWPVCYWSDLIYSATSDTLCPACSASMMTRCIRPRAGAAWPLALPMIPYMRANLARKRSGVAAADAIVAVSSTIAADLRARAPEIAGTRLEIIPNPVDVAGLRARAAASRPPTDGPYALYLGKLAPNKGTRHLVDVAERARLEWPLVIAGDGPDRPAIEAAARRSTRDIRLVGWVDEAQATAWLAHASLLIFTSRGPESLSRVLLEASALGVPIAAMNTGGTPDIVTHGETGLLSSTAEALAADVRRLVADEALRRRLGAAAMAHAERTFDTRDVVRRIDNLYSELVRSASRGLDEIRANARPVR
jgi:glycosyltransferase involved in cell wall biosynthesis